MFNCRKIVSGGQTGADRAALDFALSHGVAHGGWCPLGRLAEDGVLPKKYRLNETPSPDYAQRTEWNVRDSDATLIFSVSSQLSGGSLMTWEFARQGNKPVLHVSRQSLFDPVEETDAFLQKHQPEVLNIAGPRASKEPGVYQFVTDVLGKLL